MDSEILASNESRARDVRIEAEDGFALAARVFTPQGSLRGCVIINGATAVPQSYYSRFAAYLASRGFYVVTYDYRGVGRSRPRSLRGFDASMTDWAKLDASAVVRYLRRRHPNQRIGMVGHSFGGQLLGLSDEWSDISGAVLVGAQFGYYRHWPLPRRWALAGTWHVLLPALAAAYGYLPGSAGLGTDLPAGVAREWARWCTTPGYYLRHHPDAAQRLAHYARPLLAFSFSDDELAPRAAVDAFLATLPRAALTHRSFTPGELGLKRLGHFGFFRPEAEYLWRQACSYLSDLADGRAPWIPPSRHDQMMEEVMLDLAHGRG